MEAIGMPDTRQQSEEYIRQCLGGSYQEDLISAYLDSSPEMVRWMEGNSEVKFFGLPFPDYHMDRKGAAYGRTVMTRPYDGRRLKRLVRQIRYPLQGMSAFGSMQTPLGEIGTWQKPWASWRNMKFVSSSLLRYGADLIFYGKGTDLCNGNALVGRLLESVTKTRITLWSNTPAIEPILDQGRVAGLVVRQEGRDLRIQAKKGVVLATGGFARSASLSRKYLPFSDYTAAPRGNTGDGIGLGIASGGHLPAPNKDNGLWAPISELHGPKGQVRHFPHQALDRSKPRCILVDGDGLRFANESAPYQPFGHDTHAAGVQKHFIIGDSVFLRRYGMGLALPFPYPVSRYLMRHYLVSAPTIRELARKLRINEENLAATVEKFNGYAREGRDPDFHRGEAIYDQAYGDASNKPNPCLGPLEKPPFYALPLYPGNVSTMYGLETNINAQVLDGSGKAVPGLYAVGADMNNPMKGFYPGGGCTLGPGMVFGYRAGLHIAGKL
ncbi:uncharacterized protein A1O5_11684 [Cladophialophora psammophila CBS 110553]|uniref:FAD-dependent oxidoreductase 2 FAD-binding domain-containing protein n=1 Tax=Cladophialophora psammophila CBS 110553 TaxID=1182543 RepID=W9W5Z4_9EURO|nr:uncharacterized protein A1O5_11684 [Cladophialophora psammophila CBS 110553]EXJ63363.1 hypothetical protein A1O5_11684 [Cladophialophora psammophila CBS 110553]